MAYRWPVTIGLGMLFAGPALADKADPVGEVSTAFKLVGPNHKILVEAFDDPKIAGVACYLARPKTGGPVGINNLAAAIGEEAVTIEDVVEPYLMQIGFLQRTPRGRCATRAAYLHLGLTPPGTVADDNPRFDV